VQNALAAAGAAEIQLHDGRNTAIDELVDDRVSTAVLTLASHDAADAFPSITGFNLFKVPLSQSSAQDKAASPWSNQLTSLFSQHGFTPPLRRLILAIDVENAEPWLLCSTAGCCRRAPDKAHQIFTPGEIWCQLSSLTILPTKLSLIFAGADAGSVVSGRTKALAGVAVARTVD
jgi:hypothetical protein